MEKSNIMVWDRVRFWHTRGTPLPKISPSTPSPSVTSRTRKMTTPCGDTGNKLWYKIFTMANLSTYSSTSRQAGLKPRDSSRRTTTGFLSHGIRKRRGILSFESGSSAQDENMDQEKNNVRILFKMASANRYFWKQLCLMFIGTKLNVAVMYVEVT